MLPIRTILHPTDFSARAEWAFKLACALARDHGARLIILHVVPAPVMGYAQGVIPPEPEQTEAQLFERLQEYATHADAVPHEEILIEGDPAEEILEVAAERRADMIILGTHGWTGLDRLLMGSVAERVVRKASCPVLSVRTPFVPTLQEAPEEVVPAEVVET